MNPHISAITLGVEDFERAKTFYGKGLGWPVQFEQGEWVSFSINGGSAVLGIYPWEAAAADAGVPASGSGFRGVAFHYIVSSEQRVDAVLKEAESAGGTIVKPAQQAQWGYFGFFSDPDGYLWKVANGSGHEPHAAE